MFTGQFAEGRGLSMWIQEQLGTGSMEIDFCQATEERDGWISIDANAAVEEGSIEADGKVLDIGCAVFETPLTSEFVANGLSPDFLLTASEDSSVAKEAAEIVADDISFHISLI